ncbi:cysteine protease ATG4A [Galendromus occidentalis]|uniref:Cysteine protease n=1 Tax=Galendromus occidentalis TaxID=34638 RepID=A0AAJ6QS22_9ACAR|nr:cysteine protease ATG4A [Galendromus occidentalis]
MQSSEQSKQLLNNILHHSTVEFEAGFKRPWTAMELYASTMANEPGFIEYAEFPDGNDPVWFLGKKFELKEEADFEYVRKSFSSMLWFTYRKNFAAIGGDGPTSDTGWGCMLRAGQMMLGQALIRKHLGRSWMWTSDDRLPDRENYLRILRMFQDKKSATFSIHQISLMGLSEGKAVGEWFGPNTVAQALKKLVQYDHWSEMKLHVAMDNIIILSDIKSLCCAKESNKWRPLLLVVPLRLGLSEINDIYTNAVLNSFKMKHSLGIIGGRPSHALYFIGIQREELVFLDPHTTHNYVDLDEEPYNDSTYHCQRAQRMKISNMDPSIAMCFYIGDEDELDQWRVQAKELLVDNSGHMLFEITDVPLSWSCDISSEMNTEDAGPSKSYTSDEEFELL